MLLTTRLGIKAPIRVTHTHYTYPAIAAPLDKAADRICWTLLCVIALTCLHHYVLRIRLDCSDIIAE